MIFNILRKYSIYGGNVKDKKEVGKGIPSVIGKRTNS